MKSIVALEPCHLVKSKFATDFDSLQWKRRKSQGFCEFNLQFIEFGPVPCQRPSEDPKACPAKEGDRDKAGCWSCLRSFVGLLFGLSASILFSLSIAVAKSLNKYHAFNLGIWRSQGVLIPSIFMLLYHVYIKRQPVLEKVWPLTHADKRGTLFLVLIRSVLGMTAIIAQFYSLNFISVGDSSVIAMSTPIFVTILAYFFLREELGIVSIVATFTTLLGVFVVARPPLLTGAESFDMSTLIGIGFALLAMFFTTLVFLLLRKLNEVHHSLIGILFGGVGAGACGVLAWGFGVLELPDGPLDWALALALAVISFLAQTALTLAFQYEETGPISLVRTMDVIFAFVWQCLFFQQNPDLPSIIGAIIIISTVCLIGGKKMLSGLPEEHPLRRRLWFLLK